MQTVFLIGLPPPQFCTDGLINKQFWLEKFNLNESL